MKMNSIFVKTMRYFYIYSILGLSNCQIMNEVNTLNMKTIYLNLNPDPSKNEISEKYNNFSNEALLNCTTNSTDRNTIIWDYSISEQAYQKKDSKIIVLYDKLDLNKKDVLQLKSQIKLLKKDNSETLKLSAKNTKIAGIYQCRTGSRNVAVKNVYEVKVISKPKLEIIENGPFVEGKEGDFSCVAKNGLPKSKLEILSLKSGLALGALDVTHKYKLLPNKTSESEIFEENGTITSKINQLFRIKENERSVVVTCQASSDETQTDNSWPWKTSQIQIEQEILIQYPPIIKEIKNTNLLENSSANHMISCEADSYPEANIKWELDESLKKLRNLSEDKKTLIFNNIKFTDFNNKKITCLAENIHGKSNKTVTLKVVDEATFTKSQKSETATSSLSSYFGEHTILVCFLGISFIVLSAVCLIVVFKRKRHERQYDVRGEIDGQGEGESFSP